ncbi:MAG: hypothetical protein RR320_06075, partial [Oscillospiraceae bacterium]
MRHIFFFLCAALSSLTLLSACTFPLAPAPDGGPADASSGEAVSESAPAARYHQLTPEQAKQRMEENPSLLLLDVRRLDEY